MKATLPTRAPLDRYLANTGIVGFLTLAARRDRGSDRFRPILNHAVREHREPMSCHGAILGHAGISGLQQVTVSITACSSGLAPLAA